MATGGKPQASCFALKQTEFGLPSELRGTSAVSPPNTEGGQRWEGRWRMAPGAQQADQVCTGPLPAFLLGACSCLLASWL